MLLPDLFYRYGPYGPFVPAEVFKGDFRAILGPLMATTGPDKAAEDTRALLDYLDTRADVAGRHVGAVGFCMGGGMAIAAAAAFPDRVTAVASFHGGNLATDSPNSPHLAAPCLKAEVYITAAENNRSYPPEMAEQFDGALTEADVRFRTETYPAEHGWMMGLDDLCKVLGLPGKPAGVDGGEVWKYVREGRTAEVSAYCETDIINTYRVWLRHELFRGALTQASFEASEIDLMGYITARLEERPHLRFMVETSISASMPHITAEPST